MKKLIILIVLSLFMNSFGYAQGDSTSSYEIIDYKQQLAATGHDTSRALILAELSYEYAYFDLDSSLLYAEKALKLSEKIGFAKGSANALIGFGNLYLRQGDYPKALEYQFQALELSEKFQFEREKAISLTELGFTYQDLSDYPRSLDYALQAREIFRKNSWANYNVENEISITNTYMATNKKDSALLCMQKLYDDPKSKIMLPIILQVLGLIHTSLGNFTVAKEQLHLAISSNIKNNDLYSLIWAYNSTAKLYQATNQRDSSIYYATKGFALAKKIQLKEGILINSLLLATEFEADDATKALYYRKTGELTAGIAHEIQNPLNFVNNFSEVNSELIKELKDEVIKGNMNEVCANCKKPK